MKFYENQVKFNLGNFKLPLIKYIKTKGFFVGISNDLIVKLDSHNQKHVLASVHYHQTNVYSFYYSLEWDAVICLSNPNI